MVMRMMIAAVLVTGLAQCSQADPPVRKIEMGDLSPGPDAPDSCGAIEFSHTIGSRAIDHAFRGTADRPVRVIEPNSAVTLDHNPNRLNVDLDDDGRVVRLWCG